MCLGPLRCVFLALATSITQVHLGSRGEGSVPSAKLAICRRLEINDSPPPPRTNSRLPQTWGELVSFRCQQHPQVPPIVFFLPYFCSSFPPPPFFSVFFFLREPCQSRRSVASERRRLGVDSFRWSAVIPLTHRRWPLSTQGKRAGGAALREQLSPRRRQRRPPTSAEFRDSR